MDKKRLHHLWTKLRPLNHWYFLALFLVFGLIFIFSYRQNNLTALGLRDEVLKVDKENGDVEAELRKLRAYTHGHMNAGLSGGVTNIYPPIQLKYRYERLVEAEKNRVATANAPVIKAAQDYCSKQPPRQTRTPCTEEYVDINGVKVQAIPDGLYKFDFASPIWSPDLAGWSLLASIIFMLLFIVRFSLERWFRYKLHEHS